MEELIIKALENKLIKNPDFKIIILLDETRGFREENNSYKSSYKLLSNLPKCVIVN